ncbi:MAG: CoA transferase [Gammaproteobacteria bacterium]|nr:CoA transferase [Gammaproteobacteria bacterium]MBU2408563.1 CoA transferase [Gammaproteobacteria bacterium]
MNSTTPSTARREATAPVPSTPLAGVRVIDLGQYIAGPGAAMTLAELGADVIKVEPLAGDQARHIGRYGESMIRAYNRGKRSIALDLKHPQGLAAALRLIAGSDVVIQNLRPGAVEKLGLGPQPLRERDPRLIYLSISGFGSRGPSRDRPGLDIAAQAESGLMSVTGEPDRLPQKVGTPIVDAATAHLGAQAVLAALFARERSGVGETIETSLLEVAMHLQTPTWCDYLGGAPEPTRMGDGQPNNAPAAEVMPTRDGHIVLSAYAEEHWARLCRLMGREELIADPRFDTNRHRVENRPALREVLRDWLAGFTSDECVQLLGRNGIVAGAVRSYSQVLASPDLAASGMLVEAPASDGTGYRALGLPYRLGDRPRAEPAAAPDIGAHCDDVLAEAGYSATEIDALKRAGIAG